MIDHHHSGSHHHHQLQPSLPLEPPAVTSSQQYGQTDEDILFVCAEEIINLDPPIPHQQQQQQQHQQQQKLELFPSDPTLEPSQQQGRIYVSDNLMEPVPPQCVAIPPAPPPPPPTSPAIPMVIDGNSPLSKMEQIALDGPAVGGGSGDQYGGVTDKERTRSRGRPKGAKQTGITKLKKLYTNLTPLEEGYKCDLVDCGARFRQMETLAYHKKCHYDGGGGGGGGSSTDVWIRCPECGSLEFRNWNTLHTHLWREHTIDMELYSCHLCNFKTPVLCRLNNTHMKIHSDEKNFVCSVCDKRFKNNKQLRNHRRSHRDQQQQVPQQRPPAPPPQERTPERLTTTSSTSSFGNSSATIGKPVKCVKCGLKFPNQKSLKSHVELKHAPEVTATVSTGSVEGRLRCSLCGMVFKTRYLLQSHVAKHSDEKRFKCTNCDYSTNDHNAIRRHKMRHNSGGGGHMYRCSYCDYTSIQSTTYRKHLERMHADVASALLYKCSRCSFVSISEVKYQLHRAKHESDEPLEHQPEEDHEAQPAGSEPDQERLCESVNSDVVIVEGRTEADPEEAEPPLDAFSLIAANDQQTPLLQPMIRPAGFAHNLSKVDNFYGYPGPLDGQHYQQQQQQQQQGMDGQQQQQQMAIAPEGAGELGHDGMGALGYGESVLGS